MDGRCVGVTTALLLTIAVGGGYAIRAVSERDAEIAQLKLDLGTVTIQRHETLALATGYTGERDTHRALISACEDKAIASAIVIEQLQCRVRDAEDTGRPLPKFGRW